MLIRLDEEDSILGRCQKCKNTGIVDRVLCTEYGSGFLCEKCIENIEYINDVVQSLPFLGKAKVKNDLLGNCCDCTGIIINASREYPCWKIKDEKYDLILRIGGRYVLTNSILFDVLEA